MFPQYVGSLYRHTAQYLKRHSSFFRHGNNPEDNILRPYLQGTYFERKMELIEFLETDVFTARSPLIYVTAILSLAV
jgi:hypothetical protein